MIQERPFVLLRPAQLPRSNEELFCADERVTRALEIVRSASPPTPDPMALCLARTALKLLGLTDGDLPPVANDPHETHDNRANDRVFNIVRVSGATVPTLLHSTLQGFIVVLEEALGTGSSLSADEWGRLRMAFAALFRRLGHPGGHRSQLDEVAETGFPLRPPGPSGAAAHTGSIRRWIHGHHLFMVLIQGLVVALGCFRREVEASALDDAADSLRCATRLMWGVGAALKFTGDFSYSDYEKEIRPRLTPPNAPPDLTGLHWRDHQHMIGLIAQVRPLLATIDPSLQQGLRAFREALAYAYEAHKFVCSSLVGHDTPSLLMASRKDRPAVATLDRLKRARMNLVTDNAH